MPLSINVGLSRKASRDYQSTGVSVNITAELDQSLLAKPDELQRQINDLYGQAQQALDSRAGSPPAPQRNGNGYVRRANGNGYQNGRRNGNGHQNSNSNGRNGASATESQMRAINAIATRLAVDPQVEAREIIGNDLGDLSLRQASDLIDHLKGLETSGNGNGHR